MGPLSLYTILHVYTSTYVYEVDVSYIVAESTRNSTIIMAQSGMATNVGAAPPSVTIHIGGVQPDGSRKFLRFTPMISDTLETPSMQHVSCKLKGIMHDYN